MDESIQSKGGKARAAGLTKEQRSQLASEAATSRWASHVGTIPRETHAGILKIGDLEIHCAVLNNGMRVLSTTGVSAAFGSKKKSVNFPGNSTSPQPPPFLASENVKSCISEELLSKILSPLLYKPKVGGLKAFGYEASILPDVCEAILEARARGALRQNQAKLAVAAEVLVRGLARVGIVALVDEVTGYQRERDRDALHVILESYISKELLPWAKRFPDEFYKEMFRLRRWSLEPGSGARKGPRYAGVLTNRLVYERLPPGVLLELRMRNPTDTKGQRRHRHHQFLTDEIGHPHLDKHIASVTALMRASRDWHTFADLFGRAFPFPGTQLSLDLGSDEQE